MDYDLNKDQELIKKSAKEFLSKECTSEFVREMEEDAKGITDKLWNKMAELGWLGILIPEEYGGLEGNFLDLTVILTEMGYRCLPGPFFSTVVLAGTAILESGDDEKKKKLLGDIADGKAYVTLALTEEEAVCSPESIKTMVKQTGDDFVINQTKLFVPDAHIANYIICAARTKDGENKEDGITLFVVDSKDPGVKITPLDTFASDKLCEVIFDNVKVSKKDILGDLDKGWPILQKVLQIAAVGKCAEMVGGGQRAMEIAVENAQGREQFGKKIGSFQAVQHHCANMVTYLDTSRLMTYKAAAKISSGLPTDKAVSMAKAWVSDSCRKLAALSHQVTGGLGFMEEYDNQLYYRRIKAAGVYFGDASSHREIVAQELGL